MRRLCQTSIVATLCLLAYVVVPVAPVRLCLLAVMIWMLLGSRTFSPIVSVLAAFTFVAAFILNPLCLHFGVPLVGEIGLAGFGFGWWWLCCRNPGPVLMRRPSACFLALWCVLALAAYWPAWMADVPYRGDENFHLISVQVRWLMLRKIWPVMLVWLAAVVVACRNGGRWLPAAVAAGFAAAAVASPWFYPAELLENSFVKFRLTRYPAAESWLAALLGAAGRENWSRSIFSNEMGRLLSLTAVLCLGFVFGGDRRWRKLPVWLVALAAWGMVTSPNLLFHGAMAYLELPAILLATIVFADGRQWLACEWPRLCRRPAWWAMVLLPFTKETVFPMVLAMVALRAMAQWRKGRERSSEVTHFSGRSSGVWWTMRGAAVRLLREEWPVWLGVLGPAAVYVWLRSSDDFRPYAAMFGNYLDPDLWWRALAAMGRQYGLLVALAVYGAVVCATGSRRLRLKAALAGTSFAAMLVFMVGDLPAWIGCGRFMLMLLPVLLTLGWEGLTALRQRSMKLALVAAVALIGTNFLLSPVGRDGQRGAWDAVRERWYPYERCLEDIGARDPVARLLLANMDVPYAYSIPAHQMGWEPSVIQYPPATVEDSLAFASQINVTVVVYRDEGETDLPDNFTASGFHLVTRYPAKIGGLIVFERLTAQ